MDSERAWQVATRVTFWIVAALFAVMVVTGIALAFRYRPTVSASYARMTGLEPDSPISWRSVHRVAAMLFLPAAGALMIASIGLFLARRNRGFIALSLLAGVAAVTAAFTGYLLPWDQLSLWAVTVGSDIHGYVPILRHENIKYVILGSREIDISTFTRWFWVHTVLIPVVIVAVMIAIGMKARRRRSTAPAEDQVAAT